MDPFAGCAFPEHFADLPDPRVYRFKCHEPPDIVAIALCRASSPPPQVERIRQPDLIDDSTAGSALVRPKPP